MGSQPPSLRFWPVTGREAAAGAMDGRTAGRVVRSLARHAGQNG